MGYIGSGVQRFNTADGLTVTGSAEINSLTYPTADGSNGQVLKTNGSGTLSFGTVSTDLVNDTSPQLGGALDVNGNSITSASNGDVTIDPNGTGDIVLDAKVGISTTSPESALQVTGAVNTTPDSAGVHLGMDSNYATIELAGSDGGQLDFPNAANTDYRGRIRYTGSDNKMAFFAGGAGTQTMTVTNTSVGIGTASPSRKLELNNGGTGALVTFTDGVATNFTFKTDGSSVGTFGTEAGSTQLAFMVANSERGRFTSDGKFRINATANQVTGYETLTCNGSAGFKSDQTNVVGMWQTSSSGHFIQFFGGSGAAGCGNIGFINNNNLIISNDADNSGLQFGSGSITPAYDGAGQNNSVDLGSTSTRFKDGYFDNYLYANLFAGVDDTNTLIEFPGSNVMKFVTNGGEKARIDSSGNFMVGKTSGNIATAGIELRANNDVLITKDGNTSLYLNRLSSNGTTIEFHRSSSNIGNVSVSTVGVTYNTTSDIRLKQDIEPLEATDKLMAMNPVSYNWKSDPDGPRSMGFIAQEMQEVMPEAVSTGDDDDAMMSMDYGRITPILVSALQDAHRKIEQLEQRIADMENN